MYKVKLSSKNQITLPVNMLNNLGIHSGDFLSLSFNENQLIIESLSSIKQKAINHLLDLNPYNIKKDYLNKNISYKDLAISRYEKYLKSRKLNKK